MQRVIMSGGLVAAATLAASPCVDMSIKLTLTRQECLCLVLIHLIYVLHAQHLFLFTLYTSWNNGTSYYGTSYPSPWWVSRCSIDFIWSVNSFYLLTEFIGELKDQFQWQLVVKYSDKADGPLQSIEKQLDNSIRIKADPGIVSGVLRSHAVLYSHVM